MDIAASAHAAALWVGLHLILLLVLSVLVVRQRRLNHVVFGDNGVPALIQAIRAFGNATEYVPAGLIAIGVLAFAGAPPMVVHVVGLTLFVGRVAHAIGLSRSGGVSILRTVGVMLTWLAYIAGAVALLFYAIP
jgi:uncharacterized membrane protein YecN with MAPEG domain